MRIKRNNLFNMPPIVLRNVVSGFVVHSITPNFAATITTPITITQ